MMSEESPAPSPRRRKALWLPAHPTAGAMSMDRYWRELETVRSAAAGRPDDLSQSADAWDIVCPLGDPPAQTRRAGRLRRGWEKYVAYPLLARRAVAAARPDVVHVLDHSFAHLLRGLVSGTGSDPGRGGPVKIVTVHDLAPLRADGGVNLSPRQRERFRRTVADVRLADLVLADSRHSAEDVVRLLGVAEDRVRVLPLGVDVRRFAQGPPGSDAPAWLTQLPTDGRPVVLSVGVAAARKNLGLLPAVFRALGRPACLLRVGDPLPEGLRAELLAVLGKSDGLVELGRVAEDDLGAAYRRADALLFPSRLEGFGFPLLEAMAAGCPVVSSDASSLPEVGGKAALYFSPDNAAGAAGHLGRLFDDNPLRTDQVILGRKRALLFTWQQHLARLIRVYTDTLHARAP